MDIILFPNPVLRQKAKLVEKIDGGVKETLEEMGEAMLAEYGVGLSAPQGGILKRLLVVDRSGGKGAPDVVKLVNSVMEFESEELEEGEEGCLSFPGVILNVKRPVKVEVSGLNEEGKQIRLEAEHFLARALCHEMDHLDGRLFIDRVSMAVKGQVSRKMKNLSRKLKRFKKQRAKAQKD